MPTTTSGISAWINAFADAMAVRANIVSWNVQVVTGFVSDTDRRDSLQIGDIIEGEQEWGVIGNRRRDEKFRVNSIIWVNRPGKGDAVIRAARTRAFEILAEVEDELRLRATVTATVKVAALTRYTVEQGASTDGRWCQVDFEVSNWKDLPS
jgi:hypothetical protein